MGVTLADVERELSRRTGPFRRFGVAATPAATQSLVYAAALESGVEQGGYEGLWLLRRGLTTAGAAVVGFVAGDRSRLVKTYIPLPGALEVDRPWAAAPVAGEELEVCLLHPEDELRVAVQRGLQRCFFEDRVTVTGTGADAERDLTAARPWLTRWHQILDLSARPDGSTELASPLAWWRRYQAGGHQRAEVRPDPWPETVYVRALRPVSSWVNGATSDTGPTLDADELDVGLDYAATGAHAYAWEAFADRLQPVAQTGLKASESDVKKAWKVYVERLPRPPDTLRLAPGWARSAAEDR